MCVVGGQAVVLAAKTRGVRPDVFVSRLVKRMREKKVGSVVITNSDGLLIGVLYRKDAEERLQEYDLRRERSVPER